MSRSWFTWGWLAALGGVGLILGLGIGGVEQGDLQGSSLPKSRAIEGAIAQIDRTGPLARLSLDIGQGELIEIQVDPGETVVVQAGRTAPLEELTQGQRVKVYTRQKKGTEVATSIVVQGPVVTFPPAPQELPATRNG